MGHTVNLNFPILFLKPLEKVGFRNGATTYMIIYPVKSWSLPPPYPRSRPTLAPSLSSFSPTLPPTHSLSYPHTFCPIYLPPTFLHPSLPPSCLSSHPPSFPSFLHSFPKSSLPWVPSSFPAFLSLPPSIPLSLPVIIASYSYFLYISFISCTVVLFLYIMSLVLFVIFPVFTCGVSYYLSVLSPLFFLL